MKQFQKPERKKKEKSQPKKMQPKTKHIQFDLIGIDRFEYRTQKRKKNALTYPVQRLFDKCQRYKILLDYILKKARALKKAKFADHQNLSTISTFSIKGGKFIKTLRD